LFVHPHCPPRRYSNPFPPNKRTLYMYMKANSKMDI
jgi:hypothetical protein